MAIKFILLFLFVNSACITLSRSIGLKSLSERVSDILSKIPRDRIPKRPWYPIDFPPLTTKPPKPEGSELDLAFIMDTTGSMSPYINNVRQHIKDLVDAVAASSGTDLRIALIEYRDHRPQDTTYVTRTHHFTSSVSTMKSWLNAAKARGGGDRPEAVADAMYAATRLGWRRHAAKIGILITDAPPHGLVSAGDSFPSGSPNGHDPIDLARTLAKKGITLYTVGCEPSVVPYRDFFMAIAYLTGGQYIPLSVPGVLTSAIIAGAKEELSLKKFSADVRAELKKATTAGRTINEGQIAQSVFNKLKREGAKAQQLLKNNKPLESATAQAKAIAGAKNLAEVRSKNLFTLGSSSGGRSGSIGARPIGRKISDTSARISSAAKPSSGGSSGGESFAAVEKAVSLDQVRRLVKLESAKLSA